MLAAIVIAAFVLIIFFAALRLLNAVPEEDYEDMIDRTVELDFQDCLSRMDGYNDEVVMDQFEAKWMGYIQKEKLHYYIGRLIEAQNSFLGIGS